MKTPLIIVNFKAYPSGTGKRALKTAKALEKAGKVNIALAVQALDVREVSGAVSVPVLAQHLDPVIFGPSTGHILPEAVKEAGARGSLINHSEKRLGAEAVKLCIKRCREAGLVSVVCVESLEEARGLVEEGPDFMALEDPELIGTMVSVSQKRPENVRKFVSLLKGSGVKPLCGAGVASGEDVKAALELGTEGVLLSSVVMKAMDPGKALAELSGGLK